ncbi:MAG: hypothetical protein ATN36_07025 [Epulopiscium sp. Nele67-Bin005]|nr:MAG: hypothetical protein ATN36_07025 [Epulopiscium sp. Nele67-Bin005]
MRIRGKFTKLGAIKYVGHLDTVRLFQRAIKMAHIPVAYSEGFNPHSKVYFAMPLSVGVSSEGEYIEIKTTKDIDLDETTNSLNSVLPEGIKMEKFVEVEQQMPTLMSQVDRADYVLTLEAPTSPEISELEENLNQDTLIIRKRNKKNKWSEVDIKPLIINYHIEKNEEQIIINTQIKTGSKANLSPELLLRAICPNHFDTLVYDIHRKELYNEQEEEVTPLKDCVNV